MKKSEELRQQGHAEDNDLKALGLYNKSLREGRHERFTEGTLPMLLKNGYEVSYDDNGKYTIDTDSQEEMYGIVDFFPKANKLLIRKKNKWIKPGNKWLLKNLIKE